MLEVPQRASALDFRQRREIVRWRRRSSGPFERPRIPGIASRKPAAEVRPNQIARENQYACGLKEHAYSHNDVPDLPAATRLVGINAARHSENPRNMHEIERQMKSDDEQPAVQLA